jgi:hypothetical protein
MPRPGPDPVRLRARKALAAYLRLLAACLEDEADLIERDEVSGAEVLDRFRQSALQLSLEDAPLNVLVDRSGLEGMTLDDLAG